MDHDYYSDKETERRRDEVIRRMANTPPQPNGKPKPHLQKKKKSVAAGRAAGKGRADREG